MFERLAALIRRTHRYVYRSSITGRFVSRDYAEANPDTTVRVRVEKGQ